jgi:4,5-DOPA dioxygenase extradiol
MTISDLKDLNTGFSKTTDKMPVLFIGHGNPMNALYDNSFTQSLKRTGDEFINEKRPKAILVISAHWLTDGSYVNVSPNPEIIYDFSGFPDELYKVQYPASGSPEYAHQTKEIISSVEETTDWGIDHGSWTVLKHMFPMADIPVFQLSIDYPKPLQYHFDLAKQLRPLREKGVLIIGSGNIVHNLRLSFQSLRERGEEFVYDWVVEFDQWAKEKIDNRDVKSLINYKSAGEPGKLSVPTIDHYVPMLYSLALSDKNENIVYTHEEVTFGAMSMRCFKIG